MGQDQCQAQKRCLIKVFHAIVAIPFTPGQGYSGSFSSLLSIVLQETWCPWTFPIVPAWPDIHPGPSYPSSVVAGLPSNPFTHIPLKTDSGPSEQLPSLAAKVSSHLCIQVMWLGTFPSFGLLLHGCQLASSSAWQIMPRAVGLASAEPVS